jgi:uncharacterized protein YkwD
MCKREEGGNAGAHLYETYEAGRSFTWLTAAIFLFISATPSVGADDQAQLIRAERIAEALITQRVNLQRAALAPDAPPLVADPALNEIARARSDAMAHGAPFSHVDENGRAIAIDMMQARFGPHGTWGENILEEGGFQVFDPTEFAQRAVDSWMSSPGHRKNILSADYGQSSVGVIVDGDHVFATEVFMGPGHTLHAAD